MIFTGKTKSTKQKKGFILLALKVKKAPLAFRIESLLEKNFSMEMSCMFGLENVCLLSWRQNTNAQFGDLEQKIETLLPRAHFVNKTAEQIISLRGKNEYECELYENVKKRVQGLDSVQNYCFSFSINHCHKYANL